MIKYAYDKLGNLTGDFTVQAGRSPLIPQGWGSYDGITYSARLPECSYRRVGVKLNKDQSGPEFDISCKHPEMLDDGQDTKKASCETCKGCTLAVVDDMKLLVEYQGRKVRKSKEEAILDTRGIVENYWKPCDLRVLQETSCCLVIMCGDDGNILHGQKLSKSNCDNCDRRVSKGSVKES